MRIKLRRLVCLGLIVCVAISFLPFTFRGDDDDDGDDDYDDDETRENAIQRHLRREREMLASQLRHKQQLLAKGAKKVGGMLRGTRKKKEAHRDDDDDASAAEAASAGDLSAVGESAVEAAIAAARGAAPAAPEDDARMSSNFGCSLLQYQRKRSLSEATDDEGASQAGCDAPEPAPAVAVEDDASSQSGAGDAAAEDKGMLFELANIHATIIKLEQRAGQVEPLEARVADLERRLEASAARERLLSDALAKAAPGETPNKLADDAKRPRLISFDDK
mmetsp:Transcript_8518/g.29111  ORF Transcript_8518/g.29111 Transcript_8518/m.29111 type:complete len:277 (-) Transcript_8518:205-1035(-)